MSFSRREEYKQSGVELMGNIPTHWEVWKLAHAFSQIGTGTTPKSDKQEYYNEGTIPWVNTGDLSDGLLCECSKTITAKAMEDHSSLKLYPPGSLLFAMYGATIGKLGILDFPATVNQACCVFSGESPVEIRFLFYWFLGLRAKILSLATGGGQPNVSQDILRTLKVACPSVEEQQAIATFLDRETSKIDALVAEQRRLIELLSEKRQAVISHAVTKGLDAGARMKPSGIEWLGDVPEGWSVVPLKHLAILKSGDGITSDRIEEVGDFPVFGGNGLRGFTSEFTHDGHYVIIGRQGALCGNVNYGKGKFWASEHAVVAVPKRDLATYWFGEMIRSMNLNQYSVSAAQPGLSMEAVGNLRTAVPPVTEQHAIAEFLSQEVSRFGELSHEAEAMVRLLLERRTALISAAVTGKIDVRDAALQEAA